jgi:hypothetical protein
MIAAAPGVGKSALANAIAQVGRAAHAVRVPDTDSWTMTVRTIATNSGHPQDYVRMCLEGGHRDDSLDLALWDSRHVQFSFDSYSTAEIKDDVLAYGVVHGAFPELIVIDTLLNIAGSGDDSHSRQGQAMEEFHALAQLTGAHVLVLHHVTGSTTTATSRCPSGAWSTSCPSCPPRSSRSTPGTATCSPARSRTGQGKADPSPPCRCACASTKNGCGSPMALDHWVVISDDDLGADRPGPRPGPVLASRRDRRRVRRSTTPRHGRGG